MSTIEMTTPRPQFTPDGGHVRTVNQWHRHGLTGQQSAKRYAAEKGFAVVIWGDGHASMYTSDGNGRLTRHRWK